MNQNTKTAGKTAQKKPYKATPIILGTLGGEPLITMKANSQETVKKYLLEETLLGETAINSQMKWYRMNLVEEAQ